MHKFIFYQYIFWYLLSEQFIPKSVFKNVQQFKENSNPDLFLATNPGSQWHEAGGRIPFNRVYLMMPKGKVVQITKNPRERFSMSLLPGNGDVWAGVVNQLWHKEALRVHIWAAHTEGKESWWFCMQHLVITKVIKITRFTRLGACHCLLHLQMFSFTSQTYSNNPAPTGLQTWAASLNTEGDLLKDCWFIWPWQNVKKWKSNETHRTFLSPWLCLAWIQWTRLISTGSPITDCYLPKLWSKATTRAEERKYLWESLIPLVRNQKSKEPLETLTECKNSSLPSEKGKRPYL